MKKTICLALAILAGATLSINAAGDKKEKKNNKKKEQQTEQVAEQAAPVVLTTTADSISYTTGMAVTDGLMPYLKRQFDLDEAYLDEFKRGFLEAMANSNDPKYTAYIAGLNIAQTVERNIFPSASETFEGTPEAINPELFNAGFIAGALNDHSLFTTEDAQHYSQEKQEAAKRKQMEGYIKENTEWLAENAKKEGVVTLPSGLQYKVITEGNGAVATVDDNVTVKYEGKLIDGTVFDSSYTRNPDTTSFKPSQVIKGWTEALCMMPEGSKWELYIPQELAYGERATGKIKACSTLIFTVEVVKVN